MASIREITISNINNTDRIALNDFNGYLATSPTGLGIYRTSEYITIGNQKISTNNENFFQKITMVVMILGDRYSWEQKYFVLRDFISKYLLDGFRLYYTVDNETRYIICDINVVDKTEKSTNNLPIKLEVYPRSLWLEDQQKTSIRQSEVSGNLFKFEEQQGVVDDYNRDYYSANFEKMTDVEDEYERDYYAISFVANATQVATLLNMGVEETPLLIRLYGQAVNPIISLRNYGSNETEQYVKFNNLTINDGYYLEINSDPANTYIHLVNSSTGERFDRESFADIDSNMYITLPRGKYDILVSDEGGTNTCYTEIFFANRYFGA